MKQKKELEEKLRRTGMEFLFGTWLTPERLQKIRIFMAGICAVLGGCVQRFFWIPMGVFGYYIPDLFMKISNDADNQAMLEDIRTLYDTLRIQAKAGVFLTQSMMDCYLMVRHPRMKAALLEFHNQLISKNSFMEAIDSFEHKFDNPHLEAFCIVLRQSMESGKSIQILSDLSTQMADIEHGIRMKQKERLDRKIQLLQVLLFAGMIGICIYGMAVEVIGTVVYF